MMGSTSGVHSEHKRTALVIGSVLIILVSVALCAIDSTIGLGGWHLTATIFVGGWTPLAVMALALDAILSFLAA